MLVRVSISLRRLAKIKRGLKARAVLITEDDSERIEALDAVTGIINEDLGKRIAAR